MGNGESGSAKIPWEVDDKARANIQTNLNRSEAIVRDADKLKDAITRELSGTRFGEITKIGNPDKYTAWQERVETLEDEVKSVKLLRISRKGLKESATNPIPGFCITGLLRLGNQQGDKFISILDDDVQAPDERDVIQDEATA